MNKVNHDKKWGGSRDGAGRTPYGYRKSITVKLHPEYYDALMREASHPGMSQSTIIEQMIDRCFGPVEVNPVTAHVTIR